MTIFSDSTIQNLFSKWSKKLKVNDNFIWTDNFEVWEKLARQQKFKKIRCLPFGATTLPSNDQNLVYINKKKNNKRKELENTVIHELLHMKFPKISELNIRKRTLEILKQ